MQHFGWQSYSTGENWVYPILATNADKSKDMLLLTVKKKKKKTLLMHLTKPEEESMPFKIQNQTSANHCMEFTTISHNGLWVIKAANGTSPSDWLEHKGIVTNLQLIVFFPSMHFKSSHQHIHSGGCVNQALRLAVG